MRGGHEDWRKVLKVNDKNKKRWNGGIWDARKIKKRRQKMTANDLIVEVRRQELSHWQNSDIPTEGEEMLSRIGEHFLVCRECADEFDLQGYPASTTLQEFANEWLTNSKLLDWICST
jgi:ribosomal protein L37AE/L43A